MSEKVKLSDLAGVVRSKAAGPFVLTLDVFFNDGRTFQRVRDSGEICPEIIARLYGIEVGEVLEVTFFDPAHALKISIKRGVSAAAPGDTDVYGAQQHVPLLDLELSDPRG